MKTFIIAEAGVNHNGSIESAKKLVDAAAAAGCNAVKFQTFLTEKLVTRKGAKARYQEENTGSQESQFEMLKKLELSVTEHKELFDHCKAGGIIFLSTPFDKESVDMLDKLGMKMFKVPSGEITNRPLIQYIAAKNRPMILSTGMSYLGEVEKAIGWIKDTAFSNDLTLLHCVSDYPASAEDVNLRSMRSMEAAFGIPVGYSDHTMGIEIPLAAVAMGACMLEKHFTLDRNMEGPDHKASLEPEELAAMVKAIRRVERAIGNGLKRPAKSEENTRSVARRSLVAARNIKKGCVISPEDISIKRPGTGIPPEFLETVVGMKAGKEIMEDAVLRWDDFRDA